MRKIQILTLITIISFFLVLPVMAETFTVATGKPTLSYHTSLYKLFSDSVTRVSGGEYDVEYAFPKKGTDGSKANVKFVNAGTKANVGFSQLGATVIESSDNVTYFGPIGWEVANQVHKKGSKFKDCDALETSKARVGINTFSGSMVTWSVYGKVDKEYLEATVTDTPRGSIAKTKLNAGEIDAYYWVSAPGTKDHKRFTADPTISYGHCTDSDFDDYKVNGSVLYPKVVFSKKQSEKLGYGKVKLKTHMVPTGIIVNNDLLAEDENLYDLFTDVALMMYTANKSKGINKEWYPKQ